MAGTMADIFGMRRTLFAVFAAALGLLTCHSVSAQMPSPAEIEQFRKLPPDQQKVILDAARGTTAGVTRSDVPLTTPENLAPFENVDRDSGPSASRIEGNSTLLLDVNLIEEIGEADIGRTTQRRDQIMAGNPYRLDSEGRLVLPSLASLTLAGLSDTQATQLLNADPRLVGLRFNVTLVPVEPIGSEALKRFGYDLFDRVPTTFAPATDIPVPSDYRLGPGDNITIELFGKKTDIYELVVDRNGTLRFPDFGPMQVTGLSFDQVRTDIERRVASQMIGVRANVTMGQLRSIRIFILGDVIRPGTYTVSGLSTIINALFASGGVTKVGSLRNIELKRGGRSIARLDLYDLLLRGDTSRDVSLEQGDAIFVPPVDSAAGIGGRVRRPAIYEVRSGTSIGELVEFAGGLLPDADPRHATLERIDANRERVVLNVDLTSSRDKATKLLGGDVLSIPRVLDDKRGVMLEGFVQQPGMRAWQPGMRLTDLMGSLQALQTNADQRYVLIRRERLPDRHIEVVSTDAIRAFAQRGSAVDPLLMSGDRVMVFSRRADRGPALANLLMELQMQARDNQPRPAVKINGRVRAPGEYPLESNMTVADLVRAGGGLDESAHLGNAELTRYEIVNGESRKTAFIELALTDLATGTGAAAMPLRPYDVLVVKETPDWREQETITLTGEVRFPGDYPIVRGETLSSVLQRAGGLTDFAFPGGSIFIREEIKAQEGQQLQTLADRLQSDLTFLTLKTTETQKESTTAALAAGQALLSQLRNAKPTGRLVINLNDALDKARSEDDLELRGGDRLIVPRLKQYVTVIGEVQNPTSHVWKRGFDRSSYIEASGGTTLRADNKRIYVVRANGRVVAKQGGRWFGDDDIQPGDTVVVPIDAERTRALPILQSVTTVIYNLAVAVAAIGSL
jgi:protein involved in polysaccharide export with SLBB domain